MITHGILAEIPWSLVQKEVDNQKTKERYT